MKLIQYRTRFHMICSIAKAMDTAHETLNVIGEDSAMHQCERQQAPVDPQSRLGLGRTEAAPCTGLVLTLAQRGCCHVKEVGDPYMEAAWPWFTVTAAPGMWGQQARQARLLPLIFICSTVCFEFKSFAEREALDTPWMVQEPVRILKTHDPLSKVRGSRTERDDVW